MAETQQESLPNKATFRLLRKKDLDELAVRHELEPSQSLDKIGLQGFLKEHLGLEEYWEELKDQATREREEAQRQERVEKRQQDAEKEEKLSNECWAKRHFEAKESAAKRDHEARENAKAREHELRLEQVKRECSRQPRPSTLGTQNVLSLVLTRRR